MSLIHDIIAWCAGFVVAVISWGGYAGVALLMAIESACIPLPSELIMPFAGYLVTLGEMSLIGAATAGAVGCNLGSVVAYEVGKRGGRPIVERYGKYVLVTLHDLDRADRFFLRWGGMAVLICRLLPVVRTFIAFPAGVARMPLVKFHVYTFVGSWPWCFGLAWVGMALGTAWRTDGRLSTLLHGLDAVIVIAVLGAGGWFIWHKWRQFRPGR